MFWIWLKMWNTVVKICYWTDPKRSGLVQKQFGRIQNCFGVIEGQGIDLPRLLIVLKVWQKNDCTNSQLIQSSKFIGSCQKAMMTVDFTPIFLSLLPLFLATGTLLGLALQNAETSSTSTTPNIRWSQLLFRPEFLKNFLSCLRNFDWKSWKTKRSAH